MSALKQYKDLTKARLAAGKKSLFANLNGKFSQFDVIAIDGQYFVVQSGQYPKHSFWKIVQQYSGGYSI